MIKYVCSHNGLCINEFAQRLNKYSEHVLCEFSLCHIDLIENSLARAIEVMI